MQIQILSQYFLQYGAIFVFLIVLLEYMNLPGFPAGVIMPLAGIWASRGEVFLRFYLRHFPKHREMIERNMEMPYGRYWVCDSEGIRYEDCDDDQ